MDKKSNLKSGWPLKTSILLAFSSIFMIPLWYCNIPDEQWWRLFFINKDMQIVGFCLLSFILCNYKHLELKTALFLTLIWRTSVLLINTFSFDANISTWILAPLVLVYAVWLIRLARISHKEDKEPEDGEAFYIFVGVNSILGVVQAVFMPWHHPRYETRMISDGDRVWSVYHGKFNEAPIECTDLKKINGVRIPLGKQLSKKDYVKLYGMVGHPAVRGVRDCRKLLII
ncbi:MAG: hypothetical protein GY714_18005 [Desulfobacterales bacterium]|nr:hypothetical protein [Desulfobacterales bacterium]